MAKRKAQRTEPPGGQDSVELSSGTKVALDGDLVFLIDSLYREFAIKRGFAPAYADLQRELSLLIDQMDPESTRDYFSQSLFLNYVTYENEMAERLSDQIAAKRKTKKFRRRS